MMCIDDHVLLLVRYSVQLNNGINNLNRIKRSIPFARTPRSFFAKLVAFYLTSPAIRQQGQVFTASPIQPNKTTAVRHVGNMSYRRLLSVRGENTSITLPIEELLRIEKTGIFYSGILLNDDRVKITFKSVNDEAVRQALGVPLDKVPWNHRDFRFINRKDEITKTGKEAYTLRFEITREQVKMLDDNSFAFRTYKKDGELTALIYHDDLSRFCHLTGRNAAAEQDKANQIIQNRIYAQLKQTAARSDDKVIYRVVDKNGLYALQQSRLKYYYQDKGGKHNVAFLQSDLQKYEAAIKQAQPRQQSQGQAAQNQQRGKTI